MTCLFHGDDCRGRIQLHHCVPRQRIKRAHNAAKAAERRGEFGGFWAWSLAEAIHDERNLVPLCVFHHGQVEQKKLYVDPPESVREFAAEYGLLAELEADVARASGSSTEPRRDAA